MCDLCLSRCGCGCDSDAGPAIAEAGWEVIRKGDADCRHDWREETDTFCGDTTITRACSECGRFEETFLPGPCEF